ncbi:MAG: hypothetical protein IJU40_06685 [Desulfovibrionaceae bacterium]|nr:hypothetical protein [Desulfovibrionaceae bacterium]
MFKLISSLLILISFASYSQVLAEEFSEQDLKNLEGLLSDVQYVIEVSQVFNKNIDIINNQANTQDMLLFSLLYLDIAKRDKFHEITANERKKYEIDEYYRFAIDTSELKQVARRIFDYNLSLENSTKHDWFIIKNDQLFYFGAADSGIYPEIKITKIDKDRYGLIRNLCQYQNEDSQKVYRFKATM